jgi:hypothetical protein
LPWPGTTGFLVEGTLSAGELVNLAVNGTFQVMAPVNGVTVAVSPAQVPQPPVVLLMAVAHGKALARWTSRSPLTAKGLGSATVDF